MICKLYNYYF